MVIIDISTNLLDFFPQLSQNSTDFLGYSTISHVRRLQSPVGPPFFCDSNSTSNIAYATTTMDARRRTSMSHLSNFGYMRDESPTPSIPPPMTSISTQAYRSLQPNYLHLWSYAKVCKILWVSYTNSPYTWRDRADEKRLRRFLIFVRDRFSSFLTRVLGMFGHRSREMSLTQLKIEIFL